MKVGKFDDLGVCRNWLRSFRVWWLTSLQYFV